MKTRSNTLLLFLTFFTLGRAEIDILEDINVRPPVSDIEKGIETTGRIVINLHGDGSYTGIDLQVLESDKAIQDYITKTKDTFVAAGKEPRLFLRGEQGDLFKSSRRVIKIAADIGVNKIIFAAYHKTDENQDFPQNAENKPIQLGEMKKGEATFLDKIIKPREQDLNMALPTPLGEEVIKNTVEIYVSAQGKISIGKDKLALDQNSEVRDLPLLKAELKKMQADKNELVVSLHIDPGTMQQRVIDVLNTLAAVNISTVTFADLIEEK